MASFLESLSSTTALLAGSFVLSVALLILAVALSLRSNRRRMHSDTVALQKAWRQTQALQLSASEEAAIRRRRQLVAAHQAREREKYENGGC